MAVRELASGLDALYLSGWASLPASFVDGLERAKGRALEAGEAVPFVLGGVEFGLEPRAFGRYAYRLAHEHGLIGFTASEHLPAVRVQPRAKLLHGLGPEATVDLFTGLLGTVAEPVWSVARADLFADVQGWWPGAEDRHRFVCRAKTVTTHEEAAELTGLQFGRRSGGHLSARLYEKSAEARQTGAEWWFERWGEAYRAGEPVCRVEFEFGRTVLRECRVNTPEDLFREKAGLWGTGTEWLSYRTPSGDQTRSRWPVAPEWEAIRTVSLRDRRVTVERTSRAQTAASEKRIVAGMCGYVSSFAALRNVSTIGEALALADPALREWEHETGIPFTARVGRKLRRWGWGL